MKNNLKKILAVTDNYILLLFPVDGVTVTGLLFPLEPESSFDFKLPTKGKFTI